MSARDDSTAHDRARHARTPWTTASSRPAYANPWIRVREDVAVLPDGRTTIYGVVECAEAVGVLPFVDRDTVLLVGQYRYVAGGFYWEMPTGASHAGEPLEASVQRELTEEGASKPEGSYPGGLPHLKSILREVAHLFLAEDLRPAARAARPRSSLSDASSPSRRSSPWWSARDRRLDDDHRGVARRAHARVAAAPTPTRTCRRGT
jgi:ADP-ribose pyrophosphatase